MKLLSTVLAFVYSMSLIAQAQYTRYDDIPSNIPSYKPVYNTNFPEWAKMLYSDTINFMTISKGFDEWEAKKDGQFKEIRRYFKIWSRHIQPYVRSGGNIVLPDMVSYRQNLLQRQRATITSSSTRAGEWTFLGPKETFWLNENGSSITPKAAPWQVNIYSFDVSKSNPNILYAGTETGYVNKTGDKGITWNQLGLAYNFGGGVTATVIHPSDPNIVYVAAGGQIHKSTDGGDLWTPLFNASDQIYADQLEIDLDDPQKIFAATDQGIFVSTNGGETWTNPVKTRTFDIHRHPTKANIIYGISSINNRYALMVSQDGGLSFDVAPDYPSESASSAGGLLAVSAAEPDALFTLVLTPNSPMLYKTSGADWDLIAIGDSNAFPVGNGQGFYDMVLEVSNEDPELIYAGTVTLYKSINGGSDFTPIGGYAGDFPIHPDIQDLKVLNGGEVWVATDGGISYTNDNFSNINNTEAKIYGIIGSDMWGFDQGWNEDIVVGGRYHNGNTSIADFYGEKALRMGGAESPTGWVLQGKSRHVAFDDLGAGWILPKTAEGQPEGRFFFNKYPNMDEYGGRRSNVVYHTNYFGHIFMGEGNSIWASRDAGFSYTLMHNFNRRVRYLDIAYNNPDVLYADVVDRGLMRSEDGGSTWQSKPSLTTNPNGNSSWGGRLFFAISPTDENTIYACLQNGTWSTDIGRIFKSENGGDSWEEWTNGLTAYTKNIVVQPDENGDDIVYLFTNAKSTEAKVYVRGENDSEWEDFSDGYPAGFKVNLAKPFYRDGKLRVSGNAGVWEAPLKDKNHIPILNPWVEKKVFDCYLDTIYFEDHSIVNHEGCTWRWEITPEPQFISDPNIRNPKIILGATGEYDVTMYLTKDGNEFSKTIERMVSAKSCPLLTDCDNPPSLPKDIWSLISVDSEEPNQPGLAIMAFDNDPSTIWHTRWTSGNDTYPHEMIVDMGDEYNAQSFTYLPRQQGENGRVRHYEIYVSSDLSEWGDPAAKGQFVNSFAPSVVPFDEITIGRYFKLVCLSEVNGNIWASAAEFSLKGCYADQVATEETLDKNDVTAFPIPSVGLVTLNIPTIGDLAYKLYDINGRLVSNGQMSTIANSSYVIDLAAFQNGYYVVKAQNQSGITFTIKLLKY